MSSMTYSAFMISDPGSEISALIEAGLGHRVDGSKVAALALMRERLDGRIEQLSELLMHRDISPTKYLEQLDLALIEASEAGERILGFEDFHRVFGELRVSKLGDAQKFLEEYSTGH